LATPVGSGGCGPPSPVAAPPAATPSEGFAQALARREYEPTPNAHGLQAPNRAHDLRTYFDARGIRVHDRTAPGSPELLALTLSGVGRGRTLASVAAGQISHAGARVEIRRAGVVEWYDNSDAGLEQGFTLQRRPKGSGPLVLELALAKAHASLLGDGVVLDAGARKLGYAKLAASDASGRALAAHFELPDAQRLRLVIDD